MKVIIKIKPKTLNEQNFSMSKQNTNDKYDRIKQNNRKFFDNNSQKRKKNDRQNKSI